MAEVLWGRLTAEALRSLAQRNAVVVVPVAATEQHGPHLPTSTDTLLANEVARRAAEMATPRQPTVVTECVWTGLSEHHMAFGGTITLDFATFQAVIRGIVRSLKRHGFRRVLLVNAHGGNVAALRTITDELTFELGVPVVATTYWHHAAAELAPILERQKGIRHAGEAETSMVMAIAPELVDGEPPRRGRLPRRADGNAPKAMPIAGAASRRGRRSGALGRAQRRHARRRARSCSRSQRGASPTSSSTRPRGRSPFPSKRFRGGLALQPPPGEGLTAPRDRSGRPGGRPARA